MEITVNGERRTVGEGCSVRDLLTELDLDPGAVAVEVNLEIAKRATLGSRILQPGDRLEILEFVGGG